MFCFVLLFLTPVFTNSLDLHRSLESDQRSSREERAEGGESRGRKIEGRSKDFFPEQQLIIESCSLCYVLFTLKRLCTNAGITFRSLGAEH